MRYLIVEQFFDAAAMDPIRLAATNMNDAAREAELRFIGNPNLENAILYRLTESGSIDLVNKLHRNPPCAACGRESAYKNYDGDWLCNDPSHQEVPDVTETADW